MNKYSVQCVLLTRGMYGSGKNVNRSHSKQLEVLLKVLSFIYYSLFNTANSENDGCECDAGYDTKARVHFCVLVVLVKTSTHTSNV